MGAALSIIIEMVGAIGELTAITGFSAEALLSGEALAAIEAEANSLISMGYVNAETALFSMGVTEDMYAYMSALPSLSASVLDQFVNESIGTAMIFQTVSGSSALSLGVLRALKQQQVSIVNRNMAVVPYRDPDYYDILFPGIREFAHAINFFNGWSENLARIVGRYIWRMVIDESRHQLEHAVRDLAYRQQHTFRDALARMLENTRWVVYNAASRAGQVVSDAYQSLNDYYSRLGLNPAQRRSLFRRLELDYRNLSPEHNHGHVQDASGEVIEFYQAPGGAYQRVTPDWLLPLILGLYGDITPTWATVLEEEDGPKKKKRRI